MSINRINPIIAHFHNFEFAEVRLGAVTPDPLGRSILFFYQWKLETFLKTLGTDISTIEPLGTEPATPQNPCFSKISIIFKNFTFFSKTPCFQSTIPAPVVIISY